MCIRDRDDTNDKMQENSLENEAQNSTQDNAQDSIERDSAGFPYRALAMVLIAAALVCAIVGIFMLVDNGRHEVHVRTTPDTSSSSTVSETSTHKDQPNQAKQPTKKADTPEKTQVDKGAVRVIVLNNTTREGYAGTTSGQLKDAGWTNQTAAANCPQGSCGALSASTVFYKDTPQAKAAAEDIAKQLHFTTAARPDWLNNHPEDVVVVLAND